MENPLIIQASLEDAEEILALQKLAYLSEAGIYDDYDIPPLKQTLAEMEMDLEDLCVLKAVLDDRIVGSVRARELDGTCLVGRLMVHPQVQGRGIGATLMEALEDSFPKASRFELFTGHRSEKNLYLYKKRGYRELRQQTVNDRLTLIFLEKIR